MWLTRSLANTIKIWRGFTWNNLYFQAVTNEFQLGCDGPGLWQELNSWRRYCTWIIHTEASKNLPLETTFIKNSFPFHHEIIQEWIRWIIPPRGQCFCVWRILKDEEGTFRNNTWRTPFTDQWVFDDIHSVFIKPITLIGWSYWDSNKVRSLTMKWPTLP